MMSPERKKAQDKLRNKYGYSTNTNYGRGTVLGRAGSLGVGGDIVDVSFVADKRQNGAPQIWLYTTKYHDHGEKADEKNRYEKMSEHVVSLSLEELKLVCEVVEQMSKE